MTELKEIAGDPGQARLGPQVTMLNATPRPVMTVPGSFIRATLLRSSCAGPSLLIMGLHTDSVSGIPMVGRGLWTVRLRSED